ncbi:MAG: hypothetical protein HKP41_10885 [Desulfobacterales bacterium]|nr:hypothetical protein [Desulfobacterales bacterium]
MLNRIITLLTIIVLLLFCASASYTPEKGGDDLAAKIQNPVGAVYSLPIFDTPGEVTGTPEIPNPFQGAGATGLGDINYSVFLLPAGPGKVIWGFGPSIMMDTASDDLHGSGKWNLVPTAVALVQPKPWTLGLLGRQLWSFSGDSDRNSISQLLLQLFINYNLDGGWYLISDMIITANWKAEIYSVPEKHT